MLHLLDASTTQLHRSYYKREECVPFSLQSFDWIRLAGLLVTNRVLCGTEMDGVEEVNTDC